MELARIDVHSDNPREVVVAVCGEIDLVKHEELLSALETAVKKAGVDEARKVVVDLTQTSFVDSGAIRALVHGRQAADAASIEYVVIGASGMVRTVLEVTGVLTFLTQNGSRQGTQPG